MSRKQLTNATLAMLGTMTLLAGCSPETVAGTPTPSPNSAEPGASAPEVQNPIDPTPFMDRPCDLVPKPLLTELGYTQAGRPPDDPKDREIGYAHCAWIRTGTGGTTIRVSILQPTSDNSREGGLKAIYASHEDGRAKYFEPTEISGYPAAFNDLSDRRAKGDCKLAIGVGDRSTLNSSAIDYPDAQSSCDTARKLAETIVATVKGGT